MGLNPEVLAVRG
ncbi:hypothetical protein EYZ11_002910 [Aspergillus tanneri]|uniref:Uncharacterized protein n=1 Tax=Aspergillus tanneri TaxID=1220188 RepID=A0A4S3JQA2_9EURO|nr:hypothetical protein EYZ11_002910 [Aspergillus tanneri]